MGPLFVFNIHVVIMHKADLIIPWMRVGPESLSRLRVQHAQPTKRTKVDVDNGRKKDLLKIT